MDDIFASNLFLTSVQISHPYVIYLLQHTFSVLENAFYLNTLKKLHKILPFTHGDFLQ